MVGKRPLAAGASDRRPIWPPPSAFTVSLAPSPRTRMEPQLRRPKDAAAFWITAVVAGLTVTEAVKRPRQRVIIAGNGPPDALERLTRLITRVVLSGRPAASVPQAVARLPIDGVIANSA